MLKTQSNILKQLVKEIENTIINEQCHWLSDRYNAPARAVWAVDYKLLLNNGHLPVDLINELGLLLQYYGNELLHHIKANCPPLPLAAAISSFIYEKEESKFYELELKLNPSKDIDEIKDYCLREYLVLGYQFYDVLFFTYFHSIDRGFEFEWGIKCPDYEFPKGKKMSQATFSSYSQKLKLKFS